jgi:hypothetical protein
MRDKMSNELYISSAWPTMLCESVDVGAAEVCLQKLGSATKAAQR